MKRGLSDIYELLTQKGIPFCFFVLPDSQEVNIIAQTENDTWLNDVDITKNESGFVYRGFYPMDKLHKIKSDYYGSISDFPWDRFQGLTDNNVSLVGIEKQLEPIGKDQYLSNVEELIKSINRGEVEKVVYARTKCIPNKKTPIEIFNYLAGKHEHALRYLLKTSDGQLWFGASPEILIIREGQRYRTVALAGTVNSDIQESLFNEKNEEEQKIVSRYIEKKIKENGGGNIKISEPFASKASNVSHIKTQLSFDIQDASLKGLLNMTESLHPTPAVGGTPLKKALELIAELEPTERSLYAGYLGPYNISGQTALYVNIRSARYFEDEIVLHVGGGITKDSIPEKEWEETELKAKLIEEVVLNA